MTKAWVFTGCGSLGGWQCGAGQVLAAKEGYPAQLYGISSGAVNAVAFGFSGALKAAEFWSSVNQFSDVFTPNYFRLLSKDGVFRLSKKLVKAIDEVTARGYASTPTTIWTMDVENGEAIRHDFNTQNICRNVSQLTRASCSIPGIVESCSGRVDAGFRLLAPLKAAIEDGHDEITLISGRPLVEPTIRPNLVIPAAAAAYQAVDVALSEILRRDINECLYRNTVLGFKQIKLRIIAPTHSLGGPLSFDKCREFLKQGRTFASNSLS